MKFGYKQRGIAVAALTVVFGVVRMFDDKTIMNFIVDTVLFTLPGLLLAYGIYIWGDRRKGDNQNKKLQLTTREWLGRREELVGFKKNIVAAIVCICISFSLLMSGVSFVFGEESLMQGLRVGTFLAFLVIGTLVWKGYVLARQLLATLLTGVGLFLFLVILNSRFLGDPGIKGYVFCVLWSLFGMTLFFINRIGGTQRDMEGSR